jgi:hypothetical protein
VTRRWKVLVILAALVFVIASAAIASAVSTSTDLAGGDSLTVNCTGGGRLNQQRLSRTSIRDTCGAGTTTTTTQPSGTTTTTTTTTTMPGGGGGTPTDCTSSPSGNLGAYSYPQITNSNGFNTYVSNNMWGPQPGTTQTVCANNPGDWTMATRTTQDQGGAVQTYPNISQLTNNWTGNGFGPCGACTDVPLNRLATISSSYSITNPPTSQGAWWAAYDIWTSSGELMIVTTGSDFRLANNGGTILNPDVNLNGVHYTSARFGGVGGLPQMILHGNPTSATVDIRAVLDYWISQGMLSASATMGQFQYGWEICDTGGATLNFAVHGYSLTMTT